VIQRYAAVDSADATAGRTLKVTSRALERASILNRIPFLSGLPKLGSDDTGYFHVEEASEAIASPAGRIALRSRTTSLSFDSEDRIFAVSRHLARMVVARCVSRQSMVPDRSLAHLLRHRAATEFLLMHDFAGLVRPLIDVLTLQDLGRHAAVKLPLAEVIARRALLELAQLTPASPPIPPPGNMPAGPYRHCVDASAATRIPPDLRPDLVIEPLPAPKTAVSVVEKLRSFTLLRQAGVPFALSLLLTNALHRMLSGRLDSFASQPMGEADLCAEPVLYWTNMSVRSIFHASERRARGLPCVAVATILMTRTDSYHCDVFDAVISVGTGQINGFSAAYRENAAPRPVAQARDRLLIALQAHDAILIALSRAARAFASHFNETAVRPHPLHRRQPSSLANWEVMTSGKFPAQSLRSESSTTPDLVIAGTSNFAVRSALEGIPVVLACCENGLSSIWGAAPRPGLSINSMELSSNTDYSEIVSESKLHTDLFYYSYNNLPPLEDIFT